MLDLPKNVKVRTSFSSKIAFLIQMLKKFIATFKENRVITIGYTRVTILELS